MALTVENGTGIAGAEAYGDAAGLIAYWTARPHSAFSATVLAATTANQEGALREASAYLDEVYGAYYLGERKGYVQGLEWPRSNALDATEMPLPALPLALVRATHELAARALSSPLMADADIDGAIKRKRLRVASYEKETEYFGATGIPKYGTVAQMLAPILNGSQPGSSSWAWAG